MMKRWVAVALVIIPGLACADWPGFLGAKRNAISEETGLARSWDKDGPKVLWTLDVGEGFGGASVLDGQVFFLDREEDTFDVLRCVDLESGKELWRTSHEAPGRTGYNGSRSTPSVTEKEIVSMGPMGQIFMVDRQTHQTRWSVDLTKEYRAEPPGGWGFPQSPLVCHGLVVVGVMTDEVGLVAFDIVSGKEKWRSEPIGKGSHSSPVLAKLAGVEGVLFVTTSHLVFVDPLTGEILWDYDKLEWKIPIPVPTIVDENHLLITCGYKKGSKFFKVERNGNVFSETELFGFDEEGSQIATIVYHQNHFYGNFTRSDNETNPPGLVCLNRQGERLWQSGEAVAFGRGNLILADGMIFILHAKTGELVMVEPNPKGYKELGRVKVLEGEGGNVFAPLAISGGRLIIRDQNKMVCLDVRAAKK